MKKSIGRYTILLGFSLALITSSCSGPKNSTTAVKRITVGSGPEDMLADNMQETPRLLISCAARRESDPVFGEIVSYTPSTGAIDTLKRVGMPDSLFFQPHGIYLDYRPDPPILFAISHEHDEGFHPIYLWELYQDSIVFLELAFSPLLHSPNALVTGPNGLIFVVNDSGERGNMMEKALKLNRANVVRLDRSGPNQWNGDIVAEKLGYPAGINRIGKTIYVGDAVNHILHTYTIKEEKLVPKDPVEGLKGNDNIRIKNGNLYLTGHVKPFKFIAHTKSSENPSPVIAWEYDPKSGKITELFSTDGSLISAGSTAVLLNGKLYISQIFDPFIIEVDL